MRVEFNSLPDTSKVYLYPSNRKFYQNEIPLLEKKLDQFLLQFKGVNFFYELKYDRFILIFISNETPLTWEQHEELVSFIFNLEQEFEVSLIDKVNICFKQGAYTQFKEVPEFKKMIKNKSISKKTIVFNNLIVNKNEFENCWEIPAGESWISHFF